MKYLIALTLVALTFTGCASNVSQTVNKPITVQEHSNNIIYITVSRDPTVNQDKNYAKTKQELIDSIINKLKIELPSSQAVTSNKPSEGTSVHITFLEFNYISGAARFLTGVLSGKAKLGVKLEIVDIASNKNIGEVLLGTSSKTSEGVFGGTTGRQIEAVATEVVSLLKKSSK
jgi:Domain of unknown function (DUF4410)